jgi:hypothetical protein
MADDGAVEYLLKPDYHGNPVSEQGSLVVWEYGQDFYQLLESWCSGVDVDIKCINEPEPGMGIEGEFLDCFLISKSDNPIA